MKKAVFLLLTLFFMIPLSSYSQIVIKGQVLNSESGEPIPFVNIGIKKWAIGTVSNENGEFSLRYKTIDDLITFSAIGFEAQERSVRDLMSDKKVLLTSVTYKMDEILVEEKALGKMKNLGHKLDERGESIGFGSTQLGTEIGGLIKNNGESLIYRAFFTLNRTSSNNLLFRVNLYEFEDGAPTRNLIPENLLISTPAEPGTISVDLSPYNIVTEKDLLLSLEWVKTVSLDPDQLQQITFRADKTRRNPNTYFRSTSLAPFVSMKQFVKYNVGFYLSVRQSRN